MKEKRESEGRGRERGKVEGEGGGWMVMETGWCVSQRPFAFSASCLKPSLVASEVTGDIAGDPSTRGVREGVSEGSEDEEWLSVLVGELFAAVGSWVVVV